MLVCSTTGCLTWSCVWYADCYHTRPGHSAQLHWLAMVNTILSFNPSKYKHCIRDTNVLHSTATWSAFYQNSEEVGTAPFKPWFSRTTYTNAGSNVIYFAMAQKYNVVVVCTMSSCRHAHAAGFWGDIYVPHRAVGIKWLSCQQWDINLEWYFGRKT